ncbi:hypothetical protein RI049_08670 [Cedecea neteri]|uniref:hypothetical protein n=1 Tax=Cedecea neteri TaxID=158822 RepID=UPI002AA65E17|nr:hypothetical protein [Cedecea neteri]WPU24795.1 hypothetical protein RI049_08670 [Cedecea neteri]
MPRATAQRRAGQVQAAQLISEIGNQAADIARTQGEIAGLKAEKDPSRGAVSGGNNP